jgi:hypothetical protein
MLEGVGKEGGIFSSAKCLLASLASILYTEAFIVLKNTDKSGFHIVEHARCDVYSLLGCDALYFRHIKHDHKLHTYIDSHITSGIL